MPSTPYIIPIQIKESDNSTPTSAYTVRMKNETTGEILSKTTDTSGQCLFNLENLNLGWSEGDFLEFNVSGVGTAPNGQVLKFKAICRQSAAQIEEMDISYET